MIDNGNGGNGTAYFRNKYHQLQEQAAFYHILEVPVWEHHNSGGGSDGSQQANQWFTNYIGGGNGVNSPNSNSRWWRRRIHYVGDLRWNFRFDQI